MTNLFTSSDTTNLVGTNFHNYILALRAINAGDDKAFKTAVKALKNCSAANVDLLNVMMTLSPANPKRDIAKGLKELTKLSDKGNIEATFQLARLYELAQRGWEVEDPDALEPIYSCWFYYENNEVSDENRKLTLPIDAYDNRAVDDSDLNVTVNEDGTKSYTLKNKRDSNGKPIIVYPVADKDGVDGVNILNQKVNICRNWFKSAWNADLDALRAEVQKRQKNVNTEFTEQLLQEIYNIK